ncbi:VOC family protein [Magnetospirillum fulvum]|uniref:Aldoketomutase n=1 Tax=Magnetospirillum fulvum MGU-K5 TaxID=1316936 RepID=S9TKS9_MAGFU|nr:VOC family protein [Magnetospirillum fulvum]EPY02866.1 glyoxalase [Magnetospirillum fulvum MGU-K5]
MHDTQPLLKIAVAGGPSGLIDQHFGQADSFQIFQQGPDGPDAIECRDIAAFAQGDEDRRDTICRMLADCQVLLVAKIGPNPQEKLARAGIEASDRHAGRPIIEAVAETLAAKAQAARPQSPIDASGFRLIHTMLRVTDIERSLDFYTRLLGMKIWEKRDHQRNQFTQAYVGYDSGPALELVFNWSHEGAYALGESFGHIAIAVSGVTALCDRLAAEGVAMPRPPRSQRHGESIVAFIEDPDGHRIELVQPPAA